MEPPTSRDELFRFSTRVSGARDLDLLVLGHRGRGGGGGLRLECALPGFPALTAGSLANILAEPSADDRSALCFRGSVTGFRQVACGSPVSLRLVDSRGNCIGHANFQLSTLLSGPLFKDFSAGGDACNIFEAEHVLTMACDEQGSIPKGADGSVPTVTVVASLRRISLSEWEHRGQFAINCTAAQHYEGASHRSSSSASPAHYSPASSSRSQGITLGCDEESTGATVDKSRDPAVSSGIKQTKNSRSCQSLPDEKFSGFADQSTIHSRSYPVTPTQYRSDDGRPVVHSSPSSLTQDKPRGFPDIIPDESVPSVSASLAASDTIRQSITCLTGHMGTPSPSDSETRFILEHAPYHSTDSIDERSEGASDGTDSIASGSSSSVDLSPVSSFGEIPKSVRELPVNQSLTESVSRAAIEDSSAIVGTVPPVINSPAVAKEFSSSESYLVLDTDLKVNDNKAVKKKKKKHSKKEGDTIRTTYNKVKSFSLDNQLASPLLNDTETVTSIEMDLPSSSNKDIFRCHSSLALDKSLTGSHCRSVKQNKRDGKTQSQTRVGICAVKSHPQSPIAPNTYLTSKRDFNDAATTAAEKSSHHETPPKKWSYTEKLTTQYHECNSSHLMYRARYSVTKIIVFDDSLCGILFIGFQHPQLEEQSVLTKVVIKSANENVTPSGLVGTVKVCTRRGDVLEQVAALPPMMNVSHHKVRCDPHLVQAELSFVVEEPGKFALYRVATGEVVGTIHADLRILGPYRCPAVICDQLGNTCLPGINEELTEDESQSVSTEDKLRKVRRSHDCDHMPDSVRDSKSGKTAWREREVLENIDDMYADVCRMTEETQILKQREEWLDPDVRRVWMWRLEILEERYKRACQQYREHYGISN